MGFNVALSQLLTAPPYAGSAIVMFLCAWLGDKYHVRGPLLLFTAALGLLGLPLLVRRLSPYYPPILFPITTDKNISLDAGLGR